VLQIGSPALQSHCIFLYIPYTNSLPPHPTSHNENCTDFLWKASLYAKLRGGCAHNTFAISITFTKSHNKIIQIEIGQTLDLTTPQSHINSQRKIFMYILDKKKNPNIIKKTILPFLVSLHTSSLKRMKYVVGLFFNF